MINHLWLWVDETTRECKHCGTIMGWDMGREGADHSVEIPHCQAREDAVNARGYERKLSNGMIKNSATGIVSEDTAINIRDINVRP